MLSVIVPTYNERENVRALIERGDEVRVLDDLSTGPPEAVPEGAELVRGTLLDEDACRRAVEGAGAVFHLAALRSVPRSVEAPLPSHEANATGTLKLLVASSDAEGERFVLASSSSVYGAHTSLPFSVHQNVRVRTPTRPTRRSSRASGTRSSRAGGR